MDRDPHLVRLPSASQEVFLFQADCYLGVTATCDLMPAFLLIASLLASILSGCSSTRGFEKAKVNAVPLPPDDSLYYPPFAEYIRVAGTVKALLVVDTAGRVDSIAILKEDPKGFEFADSVISNVKKMRFKPAEGKHGKIRQKFTRQFNFEVACHQRDSVCTEDTLSYGYSDTFGNRYRVGTEAGLIRTSFVYARSGEFLESMYWVNPDSSIVMYTRDHSAFESADTGCEPLLFSLFHDSCTRSSAELMVGFQDYWKKFEKIAARHFPGADSLGKGIQITYKVAPHGKVIRLYLNRNPSRNRAFAGEMLRLVSRIKHRRIKGRQVQTIVLQPLRD